MSIRSTHTMIVASCVAILTGVWLARPSPAEDKSDKPSDVNAVMERETAKIFQSLSDPKRSDRIGEIVRGCLKFLEESEGSAKTDADRLNIAQRRLILLCNVLGNCFLKDDALVQVANRSYEAILKLDGGGEASVDALDKYSQIVELQQSKTNAWKFLSQEAERESSKKSFRDEARFLLAFGNAIGRGDYELSERVFKELCSSENAKLAKSARGWLYQIQHIRPGRPVPAFTMINLKGDLVNWTKSERATLIRVSSVNCGACVTSPSELTELRRTYASDELRIILVQMGRDVDELRTSLIAGGAEKWPFEVFVCNEDIDGEAHPDGIAAKLHVAQLPSTYLIDKDGVFRMASWVDGSEKSVSAGIRALLDR